jgi:hypothetical protein
MSIGDIPEVLRSVQTRPLFVMRLDVKPLQLITAARRVGVVPGGVFEGERLRGAILDGSNDWQSREQDGALSLDVRLVLKTDDGVLIGMKYTGVRAGPADVLQRIDRGEAVDPASYYFRIAARFETAGADYLWLNHVVAVGIGHRRADGPVYSLFEVL